MAMRFDENEVVRTRVATVLYRKGSNARIVEVHPRTRSYKIEFELRGEHPTGDYAEMAEDDLRSAS